MSDASLRIWLLKDGEPLPVDDESQILRTGRLARALQRRGHRVDWFSGRFDHGKKRHREAATTTTILPGFDLHLLEGKGYRKNVSPARVLHQRETARSFWRLASRLPRPDAIVAAYPSPELCDAGRRVARSLRVPLVVDVRDPWPDNFLRSVSRLKSSVARPLFWQYRHLLRKSLREAASIVSMSETMLGWSLEKAGDGRCGESRVFYLGYEGPDHAASTDTSRIPAAFDDSSPLRCVFYGMFGSAHDGEVVIRAATHLHRSGSPPVEFLFAGDGDRRAAWQSLAAGNPRIRFTGWLGREEAEHHLSRSHVGFITIRGETNQYWFGNKFFEYNAHGLALINDTRGELSALIEQERIGVNVQPGDAAAIAEALGNLLAHPGELGEQMQRSGRLFSERFRAERIYDDYAGHVEEIVTRARETAGVG